MNAPEKFLPSEATLIREKRTRMGLTQLELACLLELKKMVKEQLEVGSSVNISHRNLSSLRF